MIYTFLTISTVIMMANALVSSCLVYCVTLLYTRSEVNLDKFQLVQNYNHFKPNLLVLSPYCDGSWHKPYFGTNRKINYLITFVFITHTCIFLHTIYNKIDEIAIKCFWILPYVEITLSLPFPATLPQDNKI